jgi:hypothetical protein
LGVQHQGPHDVLDAEQVGDLASGRAEKSFDRREVVGPQNVALGAFNPAIV